MLLIGSSVAFLAFTQEDEVLNHVQKLYTISENCLINFEGKTFEKILFKSSLHANLAYQLKDPKCADVLYNAYAEHILPSLDFLRN